MSNLDYLLLTGVFIVGGFALFRMLVRVIVAGMSIKSLLYSLPVG